MCNEERRQGLFVDEIRERVPSPPFHDGQIFAQMCIPVFRNETKESAWETPGRFSASMPRRSKQTTCPWPICT